MPALPNAHQVLWESYARLNPQRIIRDQAGIRDEAAIRDKVAKEVAALAKSLRGHAAGVPKPILTLSALKLLSNEPTGPLPSDLDDLLSELTGWTAREIREAYGDTDDRLLVLAELYGLLDYQESVRTPLLEKAADFATEFRVASTIDQGPGDRDGSVVAASLEVCVQSDLQATADVVYPQTWFGSCGLFWDDPKRDTKKLKKVSGSLRLPVADSAPVGVMVEVTVAEDPFGISNRYRVREGRNLLCSGLLEVKKEPGRPGASRVRHEKRARFGPGLLRENAEETLRYWVQAETLCLLLPA